jgi:hypothetical protein
MDNQVYGLTKGQLSPTSPRGAQTASSNYGSMEDPVNPLLYLLAYGAGFVAQGVPADMEDLAKMIEEAIRYPGFVFVNVQSPCVTDGEPDAQLKTQRRRMRRLEDEGHDPADRLRAMERAQHYGETLYTGVFYRNPQPPPTYETLIREHQQALTGHTIALEQLLERREVENGDSTPPAATRTALVSRVRRAARAPGTVEGPGRGRARPKIGPSDDFSRLREIVRASGPCWHARPRGVSATRIVRRPRAARSRSKAARPSPRRCCARALPKS